MKPVDKCPFCNDELVDEYEGADQDSYHSYRCRGKDNHTYIQAYYPASNPSENLVMKLIIRLGAGETRYYLRTDFLNKTTKVWSGRFDNIDQILINSPITPDLTKSMDELIEQIKMYLAFY